VLLATVGLLFALAAALFLRRMGEADFSTKLWAWTLGVTLAVQGALWLVPRLGWDELLEAWDPHFVLVPTAAAAVLLSGYLYVSPEAHNLVLMGWFAALLFTARLAGFREIVALGTLMTLGYLGAVYLRMESWPGSQTVELVSVGVFFGINLFAALVSERLRRDRERARELQGELAERAVRDSLTELHNRRYFESFLEAELGRIRRYGGVCTLALLDLDDFKHYNDTYGHQAGDRLLQRLAEILREEFRTGDVVARYGGEEFAVIMVNTDREAARQAAERARRRIAETEFDGEDLPGRGRQITASFGLAVAPNDASEVGTLVELADEALYRAKRSGKNRVDAA
jgi:diguanylate cyclase (GGDEF)-like protein